MNVFFLGCAAAGIAVLLLGVIADGLFDSVDWLSAGTDDGAIVPVIGAFLGAFGIIGAAVYSVTGQSRVLAIAAAIVGGGVMAVIGGRIASAAAHMPTDSTPAASDLAGRSGRVVTPIHPSAAGEVVVQLGGQPHKLLGRSEQDLPVGSQIVVVKVLSPSSVLVESSETFFAFQEEPRP